MAVVIQKTLFGVGNIENWIDSTWFYLKTSRVHVFCLNFSQVHMFYDANCLKLVPESTHSGVYWVVQCRKPAQKSEYLIIECNVWDEGVDDFYLKKYWLDKHIMQYIAKESTQECSARRECLVIALMWYVLSSFIWSCQVNIWLWKSIYLPPSSKHDISLTANWCRTWETSAYCH